ncbi:hypothetical protein D3C86_1939710 [compost metagenome]
MTPDGEKNQRPHWRHDHQRGVRRNVAEKGDKQHHVAGVTCVHDRRHFDHQRGQQADAFRQTRAQHQRQNRAERRKTAEVFNHIRQKPVQAFHAEQVFHRHHTAVSRAAHTDVEG